MRSDAQTKAYGVLETYAEAGTDAGLAEASVALIGGRLTPSRYPCRIFQQVEACIGPTAPSSHITNAAAPIAWPLRRMTTTKAHRTRELSISQAGVV